MIDFEREVEERVASYTDEKELKKAANDFMIASTLPKYSYNFSWLSRPIIQYPQDILAMQEIIWKVKPDLIIETGIAHGGSLIFSASMLAQLDMCDAIENGEVFDPKISKRKVLGIDIDIRSHNRRAIEAHPMSSRISMLEGSSIDESIIGQVREIAKAYSKVLVFLDSNHTHDHVLAELEAYAGLTSVGSYCVVFDTIVEDLPTGVLSSDRPWGKGNNPKTAVWDFLSRNSMFSIDQFIQNKLLITVSPDGYLYRTR
ncbi:cephalosporin hydroxylase [Pokkaliibacter plantistimulans]|uniref:Cephalosporin hydroxylase n=2 Tax=Pseudomonadota TaxID=1224 RepID=A0A2S5KUY2_9PROT|nr:cephalosporin hydroxylase [Pokkaliibacter plantistimulans]